MTNSEAIVLECANAKRELGLQIAASIRTDIETLTESIATVADDDTRRFLQTVLTDMTKRLRMHGVDVVL